MIASSEPELDRGEGSPQAGETSASASADSSKVHRFCLKRAWRLSLDSDFREAFEANESQPTRTFVLWIRRGSGASRRLGVIASKRTFHHAVERNRAKRLLREAFRLRRSQVNPEVDIVLLGRHAILKASRQDVEKDLLYALSRKGLLVTESR